MVGKLNLHREMCLVEFEDYLEGEKAKLGTNDRVVDGTGGNDASRGYAGQRNVLVIGSSMRSREIFKLYICVRDKEEETVV